MPITAAEIARMCHVSRTTVDRALKDKAGISPQTRARILKIAEEYDYRPNYLASSLSTGRTRSVGVIVFDLYNQHFSYLVNAVERYFSQRGIFTYICISNKDPNREREILRMLIDRQVDGILLVPIQDGEAFSAELRALNIDVIAVSNRLPGLPFVSGDNFDGAYQCMERFYRRGYRTVHFVCPPLRFRGTQNIYAQEMRAEGYLRFKAEHPDLSGELLTDAHYIDRVIALLEDADERPGIFCSSDLFMLDIRKRLFDAGWNPDERCALAGFDGLDVLYRLPDQMSTVVYPAEAIGEAAAKMLCDRMEGRPTPDEILLPCPMLGASAL